jgi:hypothetical protein
VHSPGISEYLIHFCSFLAALPVRPSFAAFIEDPESGNSFAAFAWRGSTRISEWTQVLDLIAAGSSLVDGEGALKEE